MLTPGVINVYQSVKRQVTPLEHVVRPEGHVTQKKQKRWVEPLEHVVHPEEHIVLMMIKEQT